ncbi:helix-turn-helix domain-containing protein [Azospirillum lipoferum]|uniref:helix-turn-helix domain-containing protein n=1 Tax=Azospirillum lipoferum TaxID=193 RepID=UPI0009DACD8E
MAPAMPSPALDGSTDTCERSHCFTEGESQGWQIVIRFLIAMGRSECQRRCRSCARVIAERFAKTLHPASLSRIVRRLNLSKQKTRPRHPQSDANAQAAFQKRGCAKP